MRQLITSVCSSSCYVVLLLCIWETGSCTSGMMNRHKPGHTAETASTAGHTGKNRSACRAYSTPLCDSVRVTIVLQAVTDLGFKLYSFEVVQKLGAEKPCDPVPPAAEDLVRVMSCLTEV